MKKLLLLLSFAAILAAPASQAQTAPPPTSTYIGTAYDTAHGNATMKQTSSSQTPGGLTVEVDLFHVTDTITGYVSLWGSLSGKDNEFAPMPGADSVAITATGNIHKLWFVTKASDGNPVNYLQVRTRCVSNTTNASSAAHVRSRFKNYK